jgi:hypothetical protein
MNTCMLKFECPAMSIGSWTNSDHEADNVDLLRDRDMPDQSTRRPAGS